MKNLKITGSLIVWMYAFTWGSAEGHALWIHTESHAQLGKEHEFTVYYADYHEGAIEQMQDWYSDVDSFEIVAVSPSGKRIKLDYQKGDSYAKGSFLPEEEGVYRLEIGHSSKTEPGKTLYQFNAVAYVQVGKKSKMAGIAPVPELVLVPEKGGQSYHVMLSGKPLASSEVSILAPSGVLTTLTTDPKGRFKLELKEAGTYFIEATTYKELPANGPTGPKAIWRCATQVLVQG